MLGRKLPSTLKIARSLVARSNLSLGKSDWPIKMSAFGNASSSISAGIRPLSKIVRPAISDKRRRASASKIISIVRGCGSIRIFSLLIDSPNQTVVHSIALEDQPPSQGKMKTRRYATRFHRVISQIGIAASFCLNPDLLCATGVGLHMDLFPSVRRYDLERGGRIIQSHRLDLGFSREGISDG